MRFLKTIFFSLVLLGSHTIVNAQNKNDSTNRYIKTNSGYLMVLRESDDVVAALENLVLKENIPSGSFSGIGFAQKVTFGFYDFNLKKFNPKTFYKMEMGSITGSVAWNENKPSVHVHGVATDKKFAAFGGHILSLVVGTGSMEIYITVNTKKLERKLEQPLNANVLQLLERD